MMIQTLAAAIHKNAVEHGWWEEDRSIYEVNALIHSEWSEALEEARAGRALVWYGTDGKPEGVAVELMDGVIRILDLFGRVGLKLQSPDDGGPATMEELYQNEPADAYADVPVPELVAVLHKLTAEALPEEANELPSYPSLLTAVRTAMAWVMHQGLNPLAILTKKHDYNRTRPFKHGKKF